MYEPSEREIKAIEAELQAEKGQGIEWDDSESCFLREEQAFHERIDEHIIRQCE